MELQTIYCCEECDKLYACAAEAKYCCNGRNPYEDVGYVCPICGDAYPDYRKKEAVHCCDDAREIASLRVELDTVKKELRDAYRDGNNKVDSLSAEFSRKDAEIEELTEARNDLAESYEQVTHERNAALARAEKAESELTAEKTAHEDSRDYWRKLSMGVAQDADIEIATLKARATKAKEE